MLHVPVRVAFLIGVLKSIHGEHTGGSFDWHFAGQNVALGKPAEQHPGDYQNQNASLAVDGKTTYTDNLHHCSHTGKANGGDFAWWRVDLGAYYRITGIRIYNRDASNRARLRGFSVSGNTSQGTSPIYASKGTDYNQTVINVRVDGTTPFNSITVSLPRNRFDSYLTLCEVEVYAFRLGCPVIHINADHLTAYLAPNSHPIYTVGQQSYNALYTVINIQCNRGYSPRDSFSIQCQPNGSYNVSKPFCNHIYCKQPTQLLHGYYSSQHTTYQTDDVIIAKCNTGYTLQGDGRRTCQQAGTWSGVQPMCSVVICTIPTITHGHFVLNNNHKPEGQNLSYQTRLQITCFKGYEVAITSTQCGSNGHWTETGPFCRIRTCTKPNDLEHGYYTPQQPTYQTNYGIIAKCNKGYMLQGDGRRTCQQAGTWSGVQPMCSIVICTIPTISHVYFVLNNKHISEGQNLSYPTRINITCFKGYEVAITSIQCESNGHWTETGPFCRIRTCKQPKDLEHGYYTYSNGLTVDNSIHSHQYSTMLRVKCNEGYKTNEISNQLTCSSDGNWTSMPTCTKKTCLTAKFKNGYYTIKGGNSYVTVSQFEDVVIPQCINASFRLITQGTGQRICMTNGELNGTQPTCVPLCKSPHVENGVYLNENSTLETHVQQDERLVLKCNLGFEVSNGNGYRICQANHSWSGEPVACTETKQVKSASRAAISGIGGGSAVIIIVLVVVGIIFYRRRSAGVRSPTEGKRQSIELSTTNTSMTIDTEKGNEYAYANDTEIRGVESDNHVYTSIQPELEPVSDDYYSFTIEKLPESAIRVTELVQIVFVGDIESKFKQQFGSFPKGMIKSYDSATKTENRGKNKYKEMYAYDETRVVLQPGNIKSETDYINACFINGFSLSRRYIAAQAPFELTLNDFWRMIWQTEASKIVMLTKLTEEEKVKCEQYWPKKGTDMYGRVQVTLISTEQFSDFLIRKFVISKDDSPKRTVLQFHFTAWPDKGVPKYASSLVHFRQKAMNTATDTTGPVVVHCSAGIGRTGTFIALDILVEQGNRLGYVDVVGCVQTLRRQRVMMVQTQEQYSFIHFALIEALMLSPSVLPASEFISTYKEALKIDPKTGQRKIDSEFEMLRKMSPAAEECQYVSANEIRNRKKNRFPDILPVDDFMPRLKGESGVDYINAVCLPSYRTKNTFVITQSPMVNTQEEFWKLVYDHNVHTIVMMNTLSELKTADEIYWPQGDVPITHDTLKVGLLEAEEEEGHNILTLEVILSNKRRKIKLLQYCYQTTDEFPGTPESILTLIELVQYWQQQTGNHPIVVHCMNGVDKSGLYCVISAVIERLKIEQDVAISQTIEVMRNCREQLITSVDQFKFCHDVVLAYINQFDTYSNFTEIRA